MKKPGLETYLYSAIGVIAMLVLLVVINVIGAQAKQRVDLTADRAYTLSAGTRAILAKIDTPVQIRFYCTRGGNAMPPALKNYARRVEDLLGEYQQAAKGKIEIRKLDPEPDSDAEDSARLDGVQPQLVQNTEQIYLGLSVSMLDQKETIPFLVPARERLLEYDVSRAIARTINPQKPVVGVMSALPVAGRMMPRQMMPQQQNEQPWVLYSELKRDFDVRTVELTADKIPDEIKLLLVIHPKAISDAAQFAIDQFILRGGKLHEPAARPFRTAALDHIQCGHLDCQPDNFRQRQVIWCIRQCPVSRPGRRSVTRNLTIADSILRFISVYLLNDAPS